MADEDEDYEITEQDQQQGNRSSSDWALLRKTTKRAERAEQELNNLKREHSFTRAGVNIDDPRAKYFVKGYDGDLDPSAIRSAAIEVGLVHEAERPQDQQAQAAGRIRNVASGAPQSDGSGFDSIAARMDEAYLAGGNEALINQLLKEGFPITYE